MITRRVSSRVRGALVERWRQLRAVEVVVAQSAVSAALAWFLAAELVGNPQPVFAPIAAMVTLGISAGQRLRRAVELVLGVTAGIAVGDGLIYVIGRGSWQIGVGAALAMTVTILAGGSAGIVSQAATSSVLVATLRPPTEGIYFTRLIDALIGGAVALSVMALLLPVNPVTVVSRVARPALNVLVEGLTVTARGLAERDQDPVQEALAALTRGEEKLDEFYEVLPQGREAATIAPLRWRSRAALQQYVKAAEYVERAVRNARVLTRRAVTLLRDDEPAPKELVASLCGLAEAAKVVQRDLRRGSMPKGAVELVCHAVEQASAAYRQGLGFSGNVVVAQVRAIATDLLGTTGLPHDEAEREVRRAGGTPGDSFEAVDETRGGADPQGRPRRPGGDGTS
ncbi:FUSC family protein [Plantactinospora sp. KLBMP9567]|uniref:FUSC family protein n=1 Tax=Plantactinospora sp. KLBMP9567 TaxID=3085900 RepID=UPI002981B89B|nr:FUSC family protein [Plantactinospora sp. KLBMP9567]MDW5324999.1 FUSC family protein [Plantactinospora sp. KLBMP9567]